MAKTDELREMSDEQVRLTWKEAAEHLFRLRIQAQTERLDAPSELRRQRRLIARCQTILNERRLASTATVTAATATATAAKPTTAKTTTAKASTAKTTTATAKTAGAPAVPTAKKPAVAAAKK